LQHAGVWEVFAGIRGDMQACGTVEVFQVNITYTQPQLLIRQFSNQHLHLFGHNLTAFDLTLQGTTLPLQLVSSNHAYIELPVLTHYTVEILISYKQVYGHTLSIHLVDQPLITTTEVVTS
jgi:hypothetical protein